MRSHRSILILSTLLAAACMREASEEYDGLTSEPPTPTADVAAFPAAEEGAGLRAREGYAADQAESAVPSAPAPAPPAEQTPGGDPLPADDGGPLQTMIIRTGTADVTVDSVEVAIQQLEALARSVGGAVGNTSVSGGPEQSRYATVQLRIPSRSWDAALAGLRPIGTVERVNVTADDVSEEYADIEARVTNARRLESRLLDLLENRTGRLDEMLNVEREIARVRGEIERMEGRARYLRTRAAVSTLTVTLREPGAAIHEPGEHPIRDAFIRAWRNFVGFLAFLIAASGVVIPLALLVWLVWFVARPFLRRAKANRLARRSKDDA